MVQTADSFPAVNAILSGPNWPGRVRVVRVDPRGASRVLIEAVTLDEQARLISRVFRVDELASLQIEASDPVPSLDGDPLGFKLAAEATRIRLAYTYDPQFAVSVAHIDPLPTSSRPFITTCCASPGSASCWPTTPAQARPSWPACCSRSSSYAGP